MDNDVYDTLVLGCGEGGKYIAWHLAKQGERVAVVEDRYVGGSCPNIACLPSKNVIHAAAVAQTVRDADAFGSKIEGFAVSMAEVQQRKRRMVEGLVAMHLDRFRASGADLVRGRGRLEAGNAVSVAMADGSQRRLRAAKIFLDLGAFASLPALPGLQEAGAMTHVELLDLDVLPDHILVLGGGYIALELAQAMRRLGSQVTIVERASQLLPREDPDVAAAVESLLRDEGITIHLAAAIERVSGRSGEAVTLHGAIPDVQDGTLTGTHLLVALGKAPNTAGIGLEEAGVELTASGFVKVDERLQTTAPNIWALGDCAGSPAFTHMSFEDFRIVRDNLAGGDRRTTGRQVPNCLFLEPELARIGLNEVEAKHAGIAYRLAELPAAAILRTRTTDETRGKLKVLIGEDDRILGFTAFAARAGELLPPVQLAMAHSLPFQAVRDLVVAHPTYAEGLVTLFGSVPANHG